MGRRSVDADDLIGHGADVPFGVGTAPVATNGGGPIAMLADPRSTFSSVSLSEYPYPQPPDTRWAKRSVHCDRLQHSDAHTATPIVRPDRSILRAFSATPVARVAGAPAAWSLLFRGRAQADGRHLEAGRSGGESNNE